MLTYQHCCAKKMKLAKFSDTTRNKRLKGNFAIFYMLAKYVPGDIKYIFTKFYRHISTNNEANRKFVILISNFSTSLWHFKLNMHCGIEI